MLMALLLGGAFLGACATSQDGAYWNPADGAGPGETPTPMPKPPKVADGCNARTDGGVRREAVLRTVDAGLGFWLRGAKIVARKDGRGRFSGWIVESLYPGDACYEGLDIKPGDVVTRINGKTVEREMQAYDVFVALRTAPAIVVDYERDGAARTMRLDIVDTVGNP